MSLSALLPNIAADLGQMLEFHGISVTHRKVTETTDTYGDLTSASNSDTAVKAMIVPIRDLDVDLKEVGWISNENYMALFSNTVDLNIRDEIIDGSKQYEVRALKQIGFASRDEYVIVAEIERNG